MKERNSKNIKLIIAFAVVACVIIFAFLMQFYSGGSLYRLVEKEKIVQFKVTKLNDRVVLAESVLESENMQTFTTFLKETSYKRHYKNYYLYDDKDEFLLEGKNAQGETPLRLVFHGGEYLTVMKFSQGKEPKNFTLTISDEGWKQTLEKILFE